MRAQQNGHTLIIGKDCSHIVIIDDATDHVQMLTFEEIGTSMEDWYYSLCNFFGVPAAAEEAGDVE